MELHLFSPAESSFSHLPEYLEILPDILWICVMIKKENLGSLQCSEKSMLTPEPRISLTSLNQNEEV